MTGLRPVTSLTERRKAATQLEISRRAAELFSTRGASAVTAEEIAAAAGIGLRTFYRYFRTKEEAVAPLLAGGVAGWIACLTEDRDPAVETSARDAIESATRRTLTPTDDETEEMLHWTRGLLRTVHDEPGLNAVWLRVQQDSEAELVTALTELMGPGADPLIVRLTAASVNAAMRIAVETWSATDAPAAGPGGPAELAERCMRTLLDHPALAAGNN